MSKIPEDMVPGTVHPTKFNGDLEIVAYKGWKDITVRFLGTGYIKSGCSSKHIRLGNVKDLMRPVVLGVGFIDEGEYSSGTGNKITPEYEAWRGMLRRCYDSKYQERQPTYKGCVVCTEWHNFQNFAEWFIPRYKEGYELDKDGIVKGNKVYSPSRCQVIRKEDNIHIRSASIYSVINIGSNEVRSADTINKLAELTGMTRQSMSKILNKSSTIKGWKLLS